MPPKRYVSPAPRPQVRFTSTPKEPRNRTNPSSSTYSIASQMSTIEPIIHSPGLSRVTMMSNSGGPSQITSPPPQPSEEVSKLQLKDLTPSEQLEILARLGDMYGDNGDWEEGAGWDHFLDPIATNRKEKEQDEQRTILENNSDLGDIGNDDDEEEDDYNDIADNADLDLPEYFHKIQVMLKTMVSCQSIMKNAIKAVAKEKLTQVCNQSDFESVMEMVEKTMQLLENFMSMDKLTELTQLFGSTSITKDKKANSLPCDIQDQDAFLDSVRSLSGHLSKIHSFLHSPEEQLETPIDKVIHLVSDMDTDLDEIKQEISAVEKYFNILLEIYDFHESLDTSSGSSEAQNVDSSSSIDE